MNMMMMPMYFSWGNQNTFLFEKFTSSNALQYWLWLALICAVNVGI